MLIEPESMLVEAHEQVDDRGLAGAGGPDDGQNLARSDVGAEVVDERLVGLVAEGDVVESRRGRPTCSSTTGSAGSGISSASSSSSKTRSAEAIVDCRRLTMLAV